MWYNHSYIEAVRFYYLDVMRCIINEEIEYSEIGKRNEAHLLLDYLNMLNRLVMYLEVAEEPETEIINCMIDNINCTLFEIKGVTGIAPRKLFTKLKELVNIELEKNTFTDPQNPTNGIGNMQIYEGDKIFKVNQINYADLH